MLQTLEDYLERKTHFVFDFDRTLAKMEIDWSNWHDGIAAIYERFDSDHGYAAGKNPHHYHNSLVEHHGDELLEAAQAFNREYEAHYATGFTPNPLLVEFIHNHTSPTFYVYSSNARPTVIRGLTEIGVLDRIKQIVSKDDVRFVKPNPEGFYAFDGFETHRDSFLMIGDSGADRGAAQAAGVDFVECTTFEKYTEEE